MWGICETQADEFMAFYYKSIDQPLKPCRPITYIYCCMSFLIAYNKSISSTKQINNEEPTN